MDGVIERLRYALALRTANRKRVGGGRGGSAEGHVGAEVGGPAVAARGKDGGAQVGALGEGLVEPELHAAVLKPGGTNRNIRERVQQNKEAKRVIL